MALGKSVAPYLCALLLRFVIGQQLHALQWVCVVVQCCAIAIVQYDACKGGGVLPTRAYYLIGTATCITAITSVWNQLIIKDFAVPLNLQNAILYFFGSIVATSSYLHSAFHHGGSRHHKGFLEGYTLLATLLVIFQAFHGLAVALVYKYADAIVKNFANSSVMAILVVISAYFFALQVRKPPMRKNHRVATHANRSNRHFVAVQTTAHSWLGIVIVLTTTYCYMNIALRMPAATAPATKEAEKESLLEEGDSGGEAEAGDTAADGVPGAAEAGGKEGQLKK